MQYCENTFPYNKQGFLNEEFHLFHLRDQGAARHDLHYHEFLKILILAEGKVNYVIEGRSYPLIPWDIVLVNRGQIHRPEPDCSLPYERFILYLSPAFLAEWSQEEFSLDACFHTAAYRHSNVLRFKEPDRRHLLSLLKKLEQAVKQKDRNFAGPLYCRLLCLEFLIELNKSCQTQASQYVPTSTLDYRVSSLASYINTHLQEELSIPVLSSVCSLSPYHMMRIFKAEMGCTIGNYIADKRLLKARELMEEGESATHACYGSGFQHYSTFLRAYKQRFGELPKRMKL